MKNLRTLDISLLPQAFRSKYYFSDDSLKYLTNLTHLKLRNNYREITSQSLSKLVHLKILDVRCDQKLRPYHIHACFGEEFSVLKSLKELEILKIKRSIATKTFTLQKIQEFFPRLQIRSYSTLADARYYVGDYVGNTIQGKGTLTCASFRYEGDFIDGKSTGKGVKVTFPKNSRYEGEFLEGKCHGKGFIKNFKGEIVYEGEWRQGWAHGKGIQWLSFSKYAPILFEKRRVLRYEGEFWNGYWHGQGSVYFPNGERFEGTFEKSSKCSGVWSETESNIIFVD